MFVKYHEICGSVIRRQDNRGAIINFRFIANAVWSTEEAVARMAGAA